MHARTRRIAAALAAVLCAVGLVACGQPQASAEAGGSVNVFSREDGSGTRSAFVELVGLEEKASDGTPVDLTTNDAVIINSTSVMLTSVAGDPDGIGYVSMGSLSDAVRAVAVDGVEATPANVKNGSYKLVRPLNLVTDDGLSDAAKDFVAFAESAEGQKVAEEAGYVTATDGAPYTPSGASGKVVVAGSSSVAPVAEKIAEAYKEANPAVTVEIQTSDSTTGITMASDGTADIGMASRALKDSEAAKGLTCSPGALDGIAVIVAPSQAVTDLTTQQVRDVFAGDVASWAELQGRG